MVVSDCKIMVMIMIQSTDARCFGTAALTVASRALKRLEIQNRCMLGASAAGLKNDDKSIQTHYSGFDDHRMIEISQRERKGATEGSHDRF